MDMLKYIQSTINKKVLRSSILNLYLIIIPPTIEKTIKEINANLPDIKFINAKMVGNIDTVITPKIVISILLPRLLASCKDGG